MRVQHAAQILGGDERRDCASFGALDLVQPFAQQAAFEGDVWQWHQDYGTWARDDGMPEPRAMNIAVFMDEVLAINGPLMLVPRSHKHGVLSAGHDKQTTSYPLWTLDNDTVTRLVNEGGMWHPPASPARC